MSQAFQQVIRDAVRYFSRRGYTSERMLDEWAAQIEAAARDQFLSPRNASALIARHLGAVYNRMVRRIPSHLSRLQARTVGRMTPELYFRRVATYPELAHRMRTELDRRVAASVDLIKIRRDEAIAATMRRFRGWASSVPAGGTPPGQQQDTTKLMTKAFRQVRFETNRLNTDQGHKLNAALNATFAEGTGAIAGIWHSNWRQINYNYRKDHKERDLKIYTIRGNWALTQGLMKPGPDGYTDQITQPAEEVYCRCHYEYVYNLDSLPDEMLTEKGRKALAALKDIEDAA